MKKHMNPLYVIIRHSILLFIVTYRRQLKLRLSLTKDPFFHFNYRGVSFLIALDPHNGYIDEKICDEGVFEPGMLDEFIKYIKPNMTFVDIGANIGQHTLFATKLVGDGGHVIAFEPIPRLYEQIKRSAEKNNMHNVNLINAGCGNKEETLSIYMDSSNMGASSIIKPDTLRELTTTPIHIIVADPILLQYTKVNIMKIDVEGFEYQTLCGLEKTIARDKPVIFLEYTPTFYEKMSNDTVNHLGIKILSFLQEYDYKIEDLDKRYPNEQNDLVNWGKKFDELTKNLPHRQVNLICTIKTT